MDNKKYLCYITYVVPMEELPPLPNFAAPPIAEKAEEPPTLPGFMPQWFNAGGFPEDDID